jgi:hypothetical protein
MINVCIKNGLPKMCLAVRPFDQFLFTCNFEVNPITHLGVPQESFQQSLVEIGSVVSEKKIFLISSPLFSNLHNRSNSVKALLKIEISSNGQNCSILSQKVPKFELYKHNDELFNIYYGIFYEL